MAVRCALINNDGIVENIVMMEENCKELESNQVQIIPAELPVCIGDFFDFEKMQFSAKLLERGDLEEVRQQKISELAQELINAQHSGTVFEGNTFATDNDSQIKYMGVLIGAMLDPNYTVDFKTTDKKYVNLNHDQVMRLCMTVKAHVEHCFQNDKLLTDKILSAKTVEELDNIDLKVGWSRN